MDDQRTDREDVGSVNEPIKKRLSLLRFSLKTLIIIMSLVAIFEAGYWVGFHSGAQRVAHDLGEVMKVMVSEQNK